MIRPILPTATTPELSRPRATALAWRVSLHRLCGYSAALVLCLICLVWVLKLWRADLHVPFVYGQDGLLTAALVKGVLENPSYWHNAALGAPFGSELYDFPMAENLHFVIMKCLGRFVRDWAAVLNLYYLLCFPLTTLTAVFVLRQFRIAFAPAIVAALLFAFLPYRLVRSEGHLFLCAYYLVPLVVLVALWLYLEPERYDLRNATGRRRSLGALIVCLLVASAGVYYAFFGCFLLLVAGAAACFDRRRLYPLAIAGALVATVAGGVLANLAPSLVYRYRHGPNPAVATRSPAEAETYGMKLVQLLLPTSDHRLPLLRELKAKYNRVASPNENDTSALGLIGSVGLLALLGGLLRRKSDGAPTPFDGLSIFNLSAVLLATVGGLGAVCAVLVTSKIRAYNRISVYIAFFALFAVALALQAALTRFSRSPRTRMALFGALGLLLAVGILDQSNGRQVAPYRALAEEFRHDADFVRRIEESLPAAASVFQLPYQAYPEPDWVYRLSTYELLRGYLHSRALHWSYGAMKGRGGDQWYATVAELPPDELLRTIARAGFDGVYIDRLGYADSAAHLCNTLSKLLGIRPRASRNGRLVFFDTSRLRANLSERLSPAQRERWREAALNPLIVSWGTGFSGLEKAAGDSWHWCGAEGEAWIENPLSRPRKVALSLTGVTGYPQASNLTVESPLLATSARINDEGGQVKAEVTVPPGRHRLRFTCDAPRLVAPADPRVLVFKVKNFALREIDDREPSPLGEDAAAQADAQPRDRPR